MPLPSALLDRLKRRGIVKEGDADEDGDDDGGEEKVYAESYDRDDEQQAGRYRGGVPECPSKVSVLGANTVRLEDPLEMLKLQQEKKRQAILEDPLVKSKARRVLKRAFEEEMEKKRGRKEKKRDKKRHHHSKAR